MCSVGEADGTPIPLDLQKIIWMLHPIEIKVLIALENFHTVKDVSEKTGLSVDSVLWAFESLKEKNLISVDESYISIYELDVEGENYLKQLFPEQRVIKKLSERGGMSLIEDLQLSEAELKIGLSWAIRLGWVSIEKVNGTRIIKLNIESVADLISNYPPYVLLNKIKSGSPLLKEDLNLLESLKKRGRIIKDRIVKEVKASLTQTGLKALNIIKELFSIRDASDIKNIKIVNELTRDIIVSGEWSNLYFRPYDVSAPVKKLIFGKKHPYREIIDEIREILIGLGFEEVISPPIEVNFWNADALFMPSDHPARDIHDVFYVDYRQMTLDKVCSREIWEHVKATHENGWETGSKGWGYWDPELALKRILRSQTTAVSVRCLSQLNDEDLPKKIFTIDRNYRPDKIDATHLMEFNQCEGIVVSYDVNFKHLLGFLKTIAEAFGIKEVKFQPAYFPFTEPSVVGYIKHDKLGWIEALPAGIFRPEVTYPLGIKATVLAWGLGIDRLAMVALGIEDIRLLFSNDLDWLRSKKIPSLWGV
jgi:phenylalanyl-tRNA synthetase alpha chain